MRSDAGSLRQIVSLLCGALLASWSATSWGQEEAVAESLFREGRQAMKLGDLATACKSFEESERLDPSIGTLLNLAICEEQLGHLATAWTDYRAVIDQVPAGDARGAMARRGAESLEPRLPRLKISVEGAPGQSIVRLDDTELHTASLGSAVPVDPGAHSVSLTLPDGRVVLKTVQAQVAQQVEVKLGLDAESSAAASPSNRADGPSNAPDHKHSAADQTEGSGARTLRIAGYVAGGVGVASFVAAGILAAAAVNEKRDIDVHCRGKVCDQQGLDAAANGSQLLRLADVGLVVGALAIASGGVLIWQSYRQRVQVQSATAGAVLTYSARFQ